jgi:hypothetical protein
VSEGVFLFVLGLLVALPLAIVGQLLTPRLERWWGGRSEKKAAELTARDARLRELARFYRANPDIFLAYMAYRTQMLLQGGLLIVGGAALYLVLLAGIEQGYVAFGNGLERPFLYNVLVFSFTALTWAVLFSGLRFLLDRSRRDSAVAGLVILPDPGEPGDTEKPAVPADEAGQSGSVP